jgi:Lipase (class 3)
MLQPRYIFFLTIIVLFSSCKESKKEPVDAPFLTAKEVVRLNQVIYKDSSDAALAKYAPGYEAVFVPTAVDGNYAIIVQKKETTQYALVIRGSVIEFSNEGFQNFILQDFNIFRIKPWNYTDSVKEAYISLGAWTGFQNLLRLKDKRSGLTIREYMEQKIPAHASMVITGHSLGGNLAYPLASYLKKELPAEKKVRLQLITFGAPAAGNAAFIKDAEGKFPEGERYISSLDIAPAFPDLERISELAKLTGLDSVLQIGKLSLGGVSADIKAESLLSLAGEILKKTNVINETNQYMQSNLHLRVLENKADTLPATPLSADAIFERAYRFHKVDMYAQLLGEKPLEE